MECRSARSDRIVDRCGPTGINSRSRLSGRRICVQRFPESVNLVNVGFLKYRECLRVIAILALSQGLKSAFDQCERFFGRAIGLFRSDRDLTLSVATRFRRAGIDEDWHIEAKSVPIRVKPITQGLVD